MKDMEITVARIADLKHDESNARIHSEANREAIRKSLLRFGQQRPILVGADGVVICGNGTLEVARSLGWTEIGVIRSSLSGSEAAAYAIADNRTAELAEWDFAELESTLQRLAAEDSELVNAVSIDYDALLAISSAASKNGAGQADTALWNEDAYKSAAVKQIVLVFGAIEYGIVLKALGAYAEKHGLASNTDCIVHLLETNGYAITGREAD